MSFDILSTAFGPVATLFLLVIIVGIGIAGYMNVLWLERLKALYARYGFDYDACVERSMYPTNVLGVKLGQFYVWKSGVYFGNRIAWLFFLCPTGDIDGMKLAAWLDIDMFGIGVWIEHYGLTFRCGNPCSEFEYVVKADIS